VPRLLRRELTYIADRNARSADRIEGGKIQPGERIFRHPRGLIESDINRVKRSIQRIIVYPPIFWNFDAMTHENAAQPT
jgi:hypothetical protein